MLFNYGFFGGMMRNDEERGKYEKYESELCEGM